MRRGQAALPAGQPPGLCVTPLTQPWVGGGSKRIFQGAGRRPRLWDRGQHNKLEVARALTGRRSFFFQRAAPNAACFSCPRIKVRVTMNREAHDPNVRTIGATGGRVDSKKSPMTINDKNRNLSPGKPGIVSFCESQKGFSRSSCKWRMLGCKFAQLFEYRTFGNKKTYDHNKYSGS